MNEIVRILVLLPAGEFALWHGSAVPVAHAFAGVQGLISMTLDDWASEFVR